MNPEALFSINNQSQIKGHCSLAQLTFTHRRRSLSIPVEGGDFGIRE
jgi:hypothetical protein